MVNAFYIYFFSFRFTHKVLYLEVEYVAIVFSDGRMQW